MRTRAWSKGAAGLGLLALTACGGMRLPSVPNSAEGWVQASGEALGTTVRGAIDASECKNLRQKVSVEEEYSLGGAVALNWVQSSGGLMLNGDAQKRLQRALNRVGKNLAAQSTRPSLPWTFGVLADEQTFNAASAPAGYVFVTRRLLRDVENEAQLAGVLAHEIAHVTLKHALTRYDDVKVSQCKVAVGTRAGQEVLAQNGAKFTPDIVDVFVNAVEGSGAIDLDKHDGLLGMLTDNLVENISKYGFEPDDEYSADEEAVRLLVTAGYDAREYVRFLDKLPRKEGLGFAHHPSPSKRQGKLQAMLQKAASNSSTFSELSATEGLQAPPLAPEFSAIRAAK
ncbi:M48 family metalloprotease [Myxococcaceae bacterium GXIMD 01537]